MRRGRARLRNGFHRCEIRLGLLQAAPSGWRCHCGESPVRSIRAKTISQGLALARKDWLQRAKTGSSAQRHWLWTGEFTARLRSGWSGIVPSHVWGRKQISHRSLYLAVPAGPWVRGTCRSKYHVFREIAHQLLPEAAAMKAGPTAAIPVIKLLGYCCSCSSAH